MQHPLQECNPMRCVWVAAFALSTYSKSCCMTDPTNCPLTYRRSPHGLPPARTTRASPDRVGGRCR